MEKQKLFNRDFLLLWSGQAVSVVGSKAFNIAIMYWIKEITGSATLMGMVLMLTNLPGIILSPIGGTVADHFSRRKILIVTDLLDGISILSLAILFYFKPDAPDLIITAIMIVSIITGICGSFFGPAISAALPDLVPKKDLKKANSLKQFTGQIASIIGQIAGPTIFKFFGPLILFIANGLSFIVSAGTETLIKIPQTMPEKPLGWRNFYAQLMQSTLEGFKYVWQNKGIRTVFIGIATINLFLGPTTVLLPFYVEDMLGKDMEWYGFLMGSMGVGFILGSVLVSFVKATHYNLLVPIILPLFALTYCGLGFHMPAYGSLLLFLTFGVLVSFFNISITTQIQTKTDSMILGRVFGFLGMLSRSLYPISLGLSGIIADIFDKNVLAIYLGCGLILLIITTAISLNPLYRDYLRTTTTSEEVTV